MRRAKSDSREGFGVRRSGVSSTRWRAALGPAVNLLIFGVALWILNRLLTEYRFADVRAALARVGPGTLGLSLVTGALGYLALIGYDVVAFRIVGRVLPLRTMLVPSFVSFAVSNSAPASVITAGGVRARLYAPYGLTAAEAAAVAGINVVTYALGLCALAGVALVASPATVTAPMPRWFAFSGRPLGALLLLGVAGYFAAVVAGRRTLLGRRVRVPSGRLAAAQLGVSVADWLLSSAALYVLLIGVSRPGFVEFLVRFLVAQVAALLVPIPGGLGVFEAVVLYLTSSGTPLPNVVAALLVYRVTYYLLPLLVAATLLIARGMWRATRTGQRSVVWLLDLLITSTPHVVAFTTFLSGILLLLTGTIPADTERVEWLARLLPLPVIETSHFLASVLGAALLVVAWGLERRVRSAYRLARLLFGFGIVLSLLRSFDLRLAAGLVLALVVLLAANRAFPPSTGKSMFTDPFSGAWVFAIGAALAVTLWIGAFAYHGVSYSNQLWWQFTVRGGDAPRALRAAVAMSVTLLLFALARHFIRRAPSPPTGGRSVEANPSRTHRELGDGTRRAATTVRARDALDDASDSDRVD